MSRLGCVAVCAVLATALACEGDGDEGGGLAWRDGVGGPGGGGPDGLVVVDLGGGGPSDATSDASSGGDGDDGRVCPPGRAFCLDDETWAQCKASGNGHSLPHTCAGGSRCDAEFGACSVPFCEPEAIECLGLRTRRKCNGTGTGWNPVSSCAQGEVCHGEGECLACFPDGAGCVDEGTAGTCNADGTAVVDPKPCPEGQGCHEFAGECRERICTPGAPGCEGLVTYHHCLPSGTGWDREILSCQKGHRCVTGQGKCISESCLANVLLLVDRSGSMQLHWAAVESSVKAVVDNNPRAAFGMLGFPTGGPCTVPQYMSLPIDYHDEETLGDWFDARWPVGATPLAEALRQVTARAPQFFGDSGGALVVLSDGVDTCYPRNDLLDVLSGRARDLHEQHDVQTYVIGYAFAGDPAQLQAMAGSGGTGLGAWIPAGNEAELTDAFRVVIEDFKLCFR